MLVLSSKKGERVKIGPGIEVTVFEVRGQKVRLGFSAPPEVPIQRHAVCNSVGNQQNEDPPAADGNLNPFFDVFA